MNRIFEERSVSGGSLVRRYFRRRCLRAPAALAAAAAAAAMLIVRPAGAATLVVSPTNPQPGDVLTLTVFPAAGEKIASVTMSSFDTPRVRFYPRADGSERAFLGLPYDRSAGSYPLHAQVELLKNGGSQTEEASTHIDARVRHFPVQHITMKASEAGKMNRRLDFRRERERVQSAMQDGNPAPLWKGSWMVPAKGHSTSSYGRKRYVNGKWWGQHSGADIAAPKGTPVVACNTGSVVLSEYLPLLRGNCVVIDHGCNIFSVYMHLSRRLVSAGQRVQKGQRIGLVGATGFVTGPHLHWEIRVAWEPVDPFHVVRYGLQFGKA